MSGLNLKSWARRACVVALLAIAPVRANADVISRTRLAAALASSSQIHVCSDKPPFGNARCVAVGQGQYRGFLMPETLSYGYLHDGQDLLIVPLGSGGSGGVFVDLLFTSVMSKPYFIGVVPSETGHLQVSIADGQILVETPVYKGNDPNCCPSAKHFIRYNLRRNALVKIDEFEHRLR